MTSQYNTPARIVIDGVEHSAIIAHDGEFWTVECSCLWESWHNEERDLALDTFEDHVMDEVRTSLRGAVQRDC